jgi:hypothetical protein
MPIARLAARPRCPRVKPANSPIAVSACIRNREDLCGVLRKQTACLRGLHAAREPVERRHTDPFLEFANLARERRLANMKPLRRGRDAAGFGY